MLTHVAVVFTGVERRHYINGELAATFADAGPLTTNGHPLRIGSDFDWERSPTGLVDEVRLWNVARTTDQIRANLKSGSSRSRGGGAWTPTATATTW